MRNTRTASRLLATLLTILMLASCFVALPAMAEETTTTDPKTVLWSYDFSKAGTNQDGTVSTTEVNPGYHTEAQYTEGYFSKNDIFPLTGLKNSGVYVSGGMMETGYQAKIYANGVTTGTDPNSDFNQLLYGIHENFNSVGQTTFFEMDFKRTGTPSVRTDTEASWSYVDDSGETVSGTGALYTEYNSAAGGNFFYYRGGGSEGHFFRVNAKGYAYTTDNSSSTGTTDALLSLEDGIYYLDSNDQKVYLPSNTTLTNAGLGALPTGKTYYLELNVLYRLGVHTEITKVTTDSDGNTVVTVVNTIYIKKADATNWETCIGTSTHSEKIVDAAYVFPNTSSGKLAIGGKTEIYTYACDGTNHLNILETPDASDETRVTCACIDCGKTWVERVVDGISYEGVEVGNSCEGSYVVWVPKDGVGAPFADSTYTTPPTGHTYNSSGVCTECGKQEFAGYLADGFYISGDYDEVAAVSTYTTDTNGRGHIAKSNNAKLYLYGDTANGAYQLSARTKPFTISFDLNLSNVAWRTGASMGNFVELVSLVNSSDGDSRQLLAVGKDPDGTSFLSFAYDFDPSNNRTKETITVALVDNGEGNYTVSTEDANYAKLQEWFAACAASEQTINAAVGGLVTDTSGAAVGYNYFSYTDDTTELTRTYTFYYPQVGQYAITENEWFNVQVTVVPDSARQAMLMLYINGELVAMRPQAVAWKDTWQCVRFGQGANRFTSIGTVRYDNIGIRVHETVEDAYVSASNQVISYAFDRFQARRLDTNYSAGYFGSEIEKVATRIGAFSDTLDDTLTLYGGGAYAHYYDTSVASSDGLQFSLTTKTGATDAATGTRYNVVSDHKYEINISLAVDQNSPIYGVNSDDSTFPLDLARLSKYQDSYAKVVLMGLNEEGYSSNGYGLYNSSGTRLSPYTTVTNNVPAAFSNIRIVVDEVNNKYSIYVNDNIAYYYDSNETLKPFYNRSLPAPTGTGVTKAKAEGSTFTGDVTKYYDFTASYFANLVSDETWSGYATAGEYLRLFQNWTNFYLEGVTVSIVPDSDIEMIGVQEQVGETLSLRFIAALDDIYVPGIGYKVEAFYDGVSQGVQYVNTSSVFKAINAAGDKMYAYECQEGDYLSAICVVGMPLEGAGHTYKFKVTPYTLDENGEISKEFDSYTAVYNAAGEYLGNDQPLDVDLSQYQVASPKVMLELKAKSASAEGEYADFYVYTRTSDPSGRYYVRYRFLYSYSAETTNGTNSATNIESFRVVGAELIKVNGITDTAVSYVELNNLLSSGEISLAVKEYRYDEATSTNAVQDFCGGFHGDEHIVEVEGVDQISLKADGTAYTPGSETKVIQCETVTFDQTTKIDRWEEGLGDDGAKEQVIEHTQSFTITAGGMTIDRTVEWLVGDFVIDSAYPMMFTLLRLDTANDNAEICRIVSTYDADGTLLGTETLELNNSADRGVLQNAAVRKVTFSGVSSGISAEASFTLGENNKGVLGSPYISYRKDNGGADNKLYVPMKGGTDVEVTTANGTATKTQPAEGDVWEISTFYNIDYVVPNN